MAARVNYNQIKKEISDSCKKAIEIEGFALAKKILEQSKNNYIQEIESHPISKELSEGPDGDNISNTLNGQENLFAFIGFDSNRSPVKELTSIIKDNTILNKKSAFDEKKLELEFSVDTPSIKEIESLTPLPFENGTSWVKGIENGISGFGYYIYSTFFKGSRSKRAIQSKNKVRSTSYRPVKYMSELYERFIRNLK